MMEAKKILGIYYNEMDPHNFDELVEKWKDLINVINGNNNGTI